HQGMRPDEVQKIAGAPTTIKPNVTGKQFVPWYFGPDRSRTAYYYKGQGRVIFSGDAGLGSNTTVLQVEYDPSDPGAPAWAPGTHPPGSPGGARELPRRVAQG